MNAPRALVAVRARAAAWRVGCAIVALIVPHVTSARATPQLLTGVGLAASGVLAAALALVCQGSSPPAMRATTTGDRPTGEQTKPLPL